MTTTTVIGQVSGSTFDQDSNQLSPAFYRVVINMNNSTSTATYPTSDANTNGAVNPYSWGATSATGLYTTKPSTAAHASQLARGNIRWQAIIDEVTKYADAQILDLQFTSADITVADNQPTNLTFTIKYDRDDNILNSVQKYLTAANGNTNDFSGSAITTTVKAIQQLIAAGMAHGGSSTGYAKSVRVYNPSNGSDTQVKLTVLQPDTPAKMFADIGVTALDGTELITSN